jgi:hypothetical protein
VEVIVETFHNPGEPSSNRIRVRPFSGQKFSQNYRVWCSVAMRESKTVGSLFRVSVSIVQQPQGDSYLRIGPHERWLPVTEDEATKFIKGLTL